MANRTIQSPGVQITEIDNTITANTSNATNVFIPGFANKGPIGEPISVTDITSFQSLFGNPTNSAERYFYYTAQQVLNSSANVLVYRLPYGSGSGINSSTDYSALIYPAASYSGGLSGTALDITVGTYFFGTPTHVALTQTQYNSILQGAGFTWSPNTSGQTTFTDVNSMSGAGLIILNKSQSAINSRYEGYYIGIIDNTDLNPATPYQDFNSVQTVNTTAVDVQPGQYVTVPPTRLNFALSATPDTGIGSVSEAAENIAPFNIATSTYNDTIALGVFKLRQSVFSPNTIALDYVLSESYTASLDYYRQINSTTGGSPQSFFMETLDNPSTQITTLVNPYISQKSTTTWLDLSGNPQKAVRFLNVTTAQPLTSDTSSVYTTRVGAPSATYNGMLNLLGSTNALYALGDYRVVNLNTKLIGNVPSKLNTAFSTVDDLDVYDIDIVCEAGLGTIYGNSFNPAASGYFDDSIPYTSEVNNLTQQNPATLPLLATNYNAVATTFVTFTSQTRQDCIFIGDPIVNIFQQNNVKTLSLPGTVFSVNTYWPLRNQFSGINTSYATTYATACQVNDIVTNNPVWVPFSGYAAAIMANMDSNSTPFGAPAGFTNGIVTGANDIAIYPKQKQRDQLYNINLNPVAYFPSEGFVVYGQKTLQTVPSAFDRINVRRTFLYLEKAVRNVMKYYVFQPNTLTTRSAVINSLSPIFDNAVQNSGIFSYKIICSEVNNTNTVINDNSLVVDIYISPTRTAEYILCNFYATQQAVTTSEITG